MTSKTTPELSHEVTASRVRAVRAAPPRSLVVIEGNALLLRSLARYFGTIYSQVTTFLSPTRAEALLASASPGATDLLISQVFPGEKSGAEWVRRWRVRFPELGRVVLTTGLDEVPDAIVGVDAIVSKPFDVRNLSALLAGSEACRFEPLRALDRRIPA